MQQVIKLNPVMCTLQKLIGFLKRRQMLTKDLHTRFYILTFLLCNLNLNLPNTNLWGASHQAIVCVHCYMS